MSIKILTKNSVENTNIDGARDNNFNAGRRSGIVKGALNQGNLFQSSSNTIALDTCELRLCGHRIVLESVEYKTLVNTPSTAIRYSLIAQVIVDDNKDVSFDLIIQSPSTSLVQENLDITGKGKFQLELGRFTQQIDGTITDIIRTADLITGGIGDSDGGKINIGNVTTNTLEAGMEAEVNVENRYDAEKKKTFTDFSFSIPQGAKGEKGDKGDSGNDFTIQGYVSSTASLPQNYTSADVGKAFLVGVTIPRLIYLWGYNETGELIWSNQGYLQGPQGPQGPQGETGPAGGQFNEIVFLYDNINGITPEGTTLLTLSTTNVTSLSIFRYTYKPTSFPYSDFFKTLDTSQFKVGDRVKITIGLGDNSTSISDTLIFYCTCMKDNSSFFCSDIQTQTYVTPTGLIAGLYLNMSTDFNLLCYNYFQNSNTRVVNLLKIEK